MKKILWSLLVLVFVISTSCRKEIPSSSVIQKYAKAIAGKFIPADGDIILKDAPAVGGHQFNVYDKKVGSTVWTTVDGTEFIPGSAPAVDWTGYTVNDSRWWFSGGVYITYCPVLPLRVVLKATTGAFGTAASYLGISDVTPNAASFPITVYDKRLGDKLTLNTDQLTALPGYTSLSFTVSYLKSIIDVDGTALTSPATSQTNWPTYVYSSSTNPLTPLTATFTNTQHGDQVVYDGLDAKITGTITIIIHVDGIDITKTVPASAIGTGMALKLTTTKVGWYHSGVIDINEADITMTTVNVPI